MTEVFPGVFVFKDLISRFECEVVLKWVAKQRPQEEAPNSMNKYGTTIVSQGLRYYVSNVVQDFVAPHAKKHYPDIRPLTKHPYGFIIDYVVGQQKSLATHFDSSDVTLNLCLGHKWTGGELVIVGEKGERFEIKHRVGQAIIHRGAQLHRAKPITSGHRTNLVLWCSARKR